MIEMTKTYRTRDGRLVRLLCVDAGGSWPVVGILSGCVATWSIEGSYASKQSDEDLIEVKPKRKLDVWVNVYQNGCPAAWAERASADAAGGPTRIACLHIEREYEEGEGLM